MNLHATAKFGERCAHEVHRFRIGIDAQNATEFSAGSSQFCEQLTDALIEHATQSRPGSLATGVFIQVWCGTAAGWRNVQSETTGAVIGITNQIAGNADSAAALFRLACNSVQMARDLEVIAGGLAGEL